MATIGQAQVGFFELVTTTAQGQVSFVDLSRLSAAQGQVSFVELVTKQEAHGQVSWVELVPSAPLVIPVVEVVPPAGMGGVFHAEKLTREYVEKSWGLLEAKLNQAIDSAFKVEVPSPLGGSKEFHSLVDSKESNTTVDHAHQAQTAIKFISNNASSDTLALIRRRREDEEAFLLMLLA